MAISLGIKIKLLIRNVFKIRGLKIFAILKIKNWWTLPLSKLFSGIIKNLNISKQIKREGKKGKIYGYTKIQAGDQG